MDERGAEPGVFAGPRAKKSPGKQLPGQEVVFEESRCAYFSSMSFTVRPAGIIGSTCSV